MRRQGLDDHAATKYLEGASVAMRNELLFQAGINFNDLPAWERRGIAVQWRQEETLGTNPKNGEPVVSSRRVAFVNYDLPMKSEFDELVRAIALAQ
jgi:tRNA(His) 5'-end guanylyltransferase